MTWISVAVNVVLTVLQIVVGLFGKSQALVADGLHSLSDLLCDFLVLFANRHGATRRGSRSIPTAMPASKPPPPWRSG